jgi:hypothetical protein
VVNCGSCFILARFGTKCQLGKVAKISPSIHTQNGYFFHFEAQKPSKPVERTRGRGYQSEKKKKNFGIKCPKSVVRHPELDAPANRFRAFFLLQ